MKSDDQIEAGKHGLKLLDLLIERATTALLLHKPSPFSPNSLIRMIDMRLKHTSTTAAEKKFWKMLDRIRHRHQLQEEAKKKTVVQIKKDETTKS